MENLRFYYGFYPADGSIYLTSTVECSENEDVYEEEYADFSVCLAEYGYKPGENEIFVPLYEFDSAYDYLKTLMAEEIGRFRVGPFGALIGHVRLVDNWRDIAVPLFEEDEKECSSPENETDAVECVNFTCDEDLSIYRDSMMFRSGTEIASGTFRKGREDFDIRLCVSGNATVFYHGEKYTSVDDFPEELKTRIRENPNWWMLDEPDETFVDENNWFEYLTSDPGFGIVMENDLSMYKKDDVLKEMMEIAEIHFRETGGNIMINELKNYEFYPEEVKKACDFLMEVRKQYPEAEVDCEGQISYANGNDGTDFDWEVNDRICELGWGVPDGTVWAFKGLFSSDGLAEVYCYPNGEPKPVAVVKRQLFSEEEALKLCRTMYLNFDAKGIFDTTLDKIEWEF